MTWRKPTATTKARGYGGQHKKLRAAWDRKVQAGTVNCWRCGHLIPPGTRWELGHDDWDRSIYRGPEHYRCNRQAGIAKAQLMRHNTKIKINNMRTMDTSRQW